METTALRLLMHLNPEQKMKLLWADAKQYNDFPLILEQPFPHEVRTILPGLHSALTIHPFYTPTKPISQQNFPRLMKEKLISLVLLFIICIMAQGLYLLLLTLDLMPAEAEGIFFLLIVLLSIITSELHHLLVPLQCYLERKMSELLPARQKTHDSHWAAQRSRIASPCLLFVPRVRYVVLFSSPDAAVLTKGAVSLLLLPWGLLATSLSPFVKLA